MVVYVGEGGSLQRLACITLKALVEINNFLFFTTTLGLGGTGNSIQGVVHARQVLTTEVYP